MTPTDRTNFRAGIVVGFMLGGAVAVLSLWLLRDWWA